MCGVVHPSMCRRGTVDSAVTALHACMDSYILQLHMVYRFSSSPLVNAVQCHWASVPMGLTRASGFGAGRLWCPGVECDS